MKTMLKAIKDWAHSSKSFFDLVMAILVLSELRSALTAWDDGNMGYLAVHIIIAIGLVTAYKVAHRKRISEA